MSRWDVKQHSIRRSIRNYARSFGITRPRHTVVKTGVALVVLAAVTLGTIGAGRSVAHWVAGTRGNAEQRRAMVVAEQQVRWLGENSGLAVGQQCFDATGVARTESEPGAQCSYYPDSKRNGCLAVDAPYCYSVAIAIASAEPVQGQAAELVSYVVNVGWHGAAGDQRVILGYRLMRTSGSMGDEGVDSVLAMTQTTTSVTQRETTTATVQPLQIHKLSDIPGGATVSVLGADCTGTKTCPVAGAYGLRAGFALATNVPDALITSCTWDFGDGSSTQVIDVAQGGCLNGRTVSHDYSSAWQLQTIPAYPAACRAPLGQDLDTHAFEVRLTLHTQEGSDVSVSNPYRLLLPAC